MKTGLVMEGGALRGLFTAGVTDVFMENNITVDGAVGVSAGAIFGSNYKSGQIGRVLRYNKRFINNWRYKSFRSLFLTGDYFGADFCYRVIPDDLDPFDYDAFSKAPMEFYAVATEVTTGKAVYRKLTDCRGEEMEWLRASASMPVASHAVPIGDLKFLDGGISDSIPLEFMEKQGYAKNIVILTQPEDYVKHQVRCLPAIKAVMRKYPAAAQALSRRHEMYNAQTAYVKIREDSGDALVIRPSHSVAVSLLTKDPADLERAYNEGREAAFRALPDVKSFIS